jgi:mannose-6-phosphate isomerase-like protein (cupin superfamily)
MKGAAMNETSLSSVIVIDEVTPKPSTCGPIREFWQARDGSCDLANLIVLPGKETDRHWHEKLTEVYLFVRGEGTMEIDGNEFSVGSRQAVMIPPGAHHQLRNSAEGELELYVLCHPQFDPSDVHH